MIGFADFVPQLLAIRFPNNSYEDSGEVVTRMNRWIEQEAIDVVSVETLVVTADHRYQHGSTPLVRLPHERQYGIQVFRVWYRPSSPHQPPYTGATQRLAPA